MKTSDYRSQIEKVGLTDSEMKIALKIRARRCYLGLKISDVAKKIGVANATYGGYERGDNVIPRAILRKIAEVLGCGFFDYDIVLPEYESVKLAEARVEEIKRKFALLETSKPIN